MLGDRPVRAAIEHSRAVVAALDGVRGTVADVGAGGGLPGLVIVHDRPDLRVVLIDRRRKRTDFLERQVRRHGLGGRVEVFAGDVAAVQRQIDHHDRDPVAAAVARGFGPPDRTLRALAGLIEPRGRIVVTEPPDGDRWSPRLLDDVGVRRLAHAPAGTAVFMRRADLDAGFT